MNMKKLVNLPKAKDQRIVELETENKFLKKMAVDDAEKIRRLEREVWKRDRDRQIEHGPSALEDYGPGKP